MPATPTELDALKDAAITALEAGDFKTARNKALAYQLSMAGVADQKKGGFAGAELSWPRDDIENFLKRIDKILNSSLGLQISTLQYSPAEQANLSEYD